MALDNTIPASAHIRTERNASGVSIFEFFRHHGVWAPGVRLFRRMNFSAKAGILCSVMVLPLLTLLVWQSWTGHDAALVARMQATQQHVAIAHGVVAWAHGLEARGELDRAAAQQLAAASLKALRYDGDNYFWINDMQPRMVMHPTDPALDGRDLADVKDPAGNALFVNFVKLVRQQGEGQAAYLWPRPGQEAPVRKVSFVKGFEPWGWIVGSGVYVDDIEQVAWRDALWMAAIAGSALLLGAYLFRSFYLVMKGGLREVSAHLKAMTDGDLTTLTTPWGNDEAASLMTDLSVMQASLKRIVTQVRDASQNLSATSEEIASASTDLSSRSEQAAANLEQASGELAAISTTIQRSSDNTLQAATLASKNSVIAGKGSEVIRTAVSTMDEIRSSSNKITDIIGVIDSIAFQTNILALNAAVEAARAGEQGRGFAVVANEVRSLAGRSAAAAKEVRSLITRSVEQVQTGSQVVQGAGEIMREIVGSADTMRSLLSDISAASATNSTGLSRIGQSVADLDLMIQQNAALVEETAATTSSVKSRSADLAAAVSVFKLTSDAIGMKRKKLSHEITASPQISIAELSRLKNEGFRSIICNRPDAEGPGQTRFSDIQSAAAELGLQARHLPIEPGKATPRDGEVFAALMRELPKPILAYCRTGMRSTSLWKLSHPGQSTLEA